MKNMKNLRSIVALSLGVALGVGCSSPGGRDGPSDSDVVAGTTLTVGQCQSPRITTSPLNDASGVAIAGSAHTRLDGCAVGGRGETGVQVLARVVALLGNTAALGAVNDATGNPVFARFTPGAKTGSLATKQTQDIDVTLAMSQSPTATLRVEMQASSDVLTLSLVNLTPVKASIFRVTAVAPGALKLTIQVKSAANGVLVAGTADIALLHQQDQAANASLLVKNLFDWLSEQLQTTAPR